MREARQWCSGGGALSPLSTPVFSGVSPRLAQSSTAPAISNRDLQCDSCVRLKVVILGDHSIDKSSIADNVMEIALRKSSLDPDLQTI